MKSYDVPSEYLLAWRTQALDSRTDCEDYMRQLFGGPRPQRNFGATLTVCLLLSFGLGTAALLYTALDRILLHPLSVSHPETLVRIAERHPPVTSWQWFPYSSFEPVRQMHSFEAVAAEGNFDTILTVKGAAQPVVGDMVSGGYFSLLGASAELGRTLLPADERGGAGSVPVVLSHRLWVQEFGGSPSAVGSTISLQGQKFTVAGVLPAKFFGTTLDSSPDLWVPLAAQSLLSNKPLSDPRSDRFFSLLGRLRSGVTVGQAQAEFAGVFRGLMKSGDDFDPKAQGIIVPISQGTFALRDQFGHALTLLLWGLGTLLLMVCANVAGLLLARGARSERDTAVRLALGASRGLLVRRVLLGSAALGLAGACGGLLVANLCAPLLAGLLPAGRTPLPISLVPNATIDLMTVGLALSVSLLFGGVPAWITTRVSPQRALRSGTATRRSGPLSRALITFQTSAALILLLGTGLLLHTFYVLRHTSPGFEVEHLITFTLDPGMQGGSMKLPPSFAGDLQRRIQALPGVRSASLAGAGLMQRIGLKTSVALPGQKVPEGAFLNSSLNNVSQTFFDTMQIPILSGRSFSSGDAGRSGLAPTVINESFARMLFPHQDPVGRTFGMGSTGTILKASNVVIGIAGDSKYRSLREALLPIYYVPLQHQEEWDSQFNLFVRTQGPPASIVSAAKNVLKGMDPGLPFSRIATMQEQISESLWQERLLAVLAIVFSVLSVLITATGLYGLLSYDTGQRTREFGIRNAVGAQRTDVAFLVIGDLFRILIPGLAIGLMAALLLSRFIASALYGIAPADPLSISGALILVLLVSLMAAWEPVRRAMNVDPAIVLREE